MSLLQLFIQALKGEPPPPTVTFGTVGRESYPLTSVLLADQARATVGLADEALSSVVLADAPINPG